MARKIILILLLLMISLMLFAQDKITLEYLIEKAMKQSISIEAELMQYKNQQSSYDQSYYSWLPRVDLNANKSWKDDVWSDATAGLSANWSIYSNDGRLYDMRTQMIEMLNSNLSLEDVKKNIAYNVLSAYIDVLTGKDLVELQREVMAVEEKKYQKIEIQQELGEVNQLDLEQAEIDKIQAEISLNDLTLSVENKRADLFYYIGCEDNGAELSDIKGEVNPQPGVYQPNLQYQIEQNSLQSTKIMKDQAFQDLLPTLSLSLNHTITSTKGIADFDLYNDSSTMSLSLSYPVFDFFTNYENYKIIRRQYEYNRRKLEDQRLSDIKELNNLNRTLDSQKRNYSLYQLKSDLAEKVFTRAQVEYDQGTLNLLDYNDYQNKLYSARKNVISEHYKLLETQEAINLLLSRKILGKW